MTSRTPSSRAQGAERGARTETSAPPAGSLPRSPLHALRSEQGFTLAGLIVILTIMSIIVAYTVPEQWSMVMQRERERQTIHIMKQFARGIRNFQAKNNGALPTNIDQLRDARNPRLIRSGGKWPCPLNGDEDGWILVPPGAVNGETTGRGGGNRRNPVFGDDSGRGGNRGRGNDNRGGGGGGRGRGQGQGQGGGGGEGGIRPPSKLNPEASPKDYVGMFVGVRPNATGKSLLTLNGAADYGEWVYTVHDLENELNLFKMGLSWGK